MLLGSLKDKISQLQEGLVGAVKVEDDEVGGRGNVDVNLNAGGEVLHHYQNGWQCLHSGSESCARQADRCDRLISCVHAEYEKQWRHVALLSSLVSELPALDGEIKKITQDLVILQDLFSEVELALLTLEETLEARETQEKQLQQRFEVSMYQERRRQELQDLESHLVHQYNKRMQEEERKNDEKKKERQYVFHQKFEEDLENYRKTGFLDVPLRSGEMTLESVNLSEDEDGDDLEAFLQDCSPQRQKSPLSSRKSELKPRKSPEPLKSPAAERQKDVPRSLHLANTTTPASDMHSRDVSMYFTPNQTMENMAEK